MDHRGMDVSPTPTPAQQPDRPPSRAQRRVETAHMVAVLSEALATQIHRLVTSTDPAPDGWWFGADVTTGSADGHAGGG